MEEGPKESVDLGVLVDLQVLQISEVSKDVIRHCILRELIRPEQMNGQLCFSPKDVLVLKVVHFMLRGIRIQAELKTICQKSKIQTNFDIPFAALKGNAETYARIAIELANEKSLDHDSRLHLSS